MAVTTVFKNFSTPVENVSLLILSNWIASEKYKNEVEEIRSLMQDGKQEEAQAKKQQLPAFTPSATFAEKRLLPNVDQYSGFVHLDFDKLDQEQLSNAKQVVAAIPYTFLSFVSPSGNGLKVFIEVNTGAEQHETAYRRVKEYYETATGLKADEKCKDITRLCFVSYDPVLYKNISNQKFKIADVVPQTEQAHTIQQQTDVSESSDQFLLLFQQQITFTNQKLEYANGNRNNYMYLLASNCNRAGIPEQDAYLLCTQHFDLSAKEIAASLRSAYTHHTTEFAKFANIAKPANDVVQEAAPAEDFLKATPSVPDELYPLMPHLIWQGAKAFDKGRERDVFLTGALAILSGCMPGVKGIYAGQEVFPNLFSFSIAPAASGKGALKFAKMMADEYHNNLVKISREAEAEYNNQVAEQKQKMMMRKKGDATVEELPVKPPFKVVFIPANTSYAKILWHLEQNGGTGIICETEADTLGNVFKQDWGSYSDMIRKSFHHERLSSSRKANNEFIEVNTPALSIALSGTPSQVTGLIASAEDGLFSRFMFYAFKVDQVWKDVSPFANNINLTEHFKQLSMEVYRMVCFLQKEETTIDLSKEQWQQLNAVCAGWLHDVTMFTAEEAASIVKRLGLMLFRMAMIFTAMRKYENAEMATAVICADEDFQIALQLTQVYLHHSILMFNNLPKQTEATQFKAGDNKRRFIEALPNEFTTKQAVEIGSRFHLSYSTVTHLLPKLVPSHFSQPKAGYYIKNQ